MTLRDLMGHAACGRIDDPALRHGDVRRQAERHRGRVGQRAGGKAPSKVPPAADGESKKGK
jgi:hypothetical protein